jgi:hypothetical protein
MLEIGVDVAIHEVKLGQIVRLHLCDSLLYTHVSLLVLIIIRSEVQIQRPQLSIILCRLFD